jgi:hypothetical protein
MSSCSPADKKRHSELLVFSNFIYILPIFAAIYMWKKGRLSNAITIEIIILLLAIVFVSWFFHSCRGEVASETDPCQNSGDLDVNNCARCNKNFGNYNLFSSSMSNTAFADKFLAQYIVILIMTYILPIKNTIKTVIRTVSLILIIVLLVSVNGTNFEYISGLLIFLVVIPLYVINIPFISRNNKIFAVMAIVCWVTALCICFIPKDRYWLFHSLWHIFGGICATFAILLASSFYDVPKDFRGSDLYHRICKSHLLRPLKQVDTDSIFYKILKVG